MTTPRPGSEYSPGASMSDRERKDRLIQTRVPESLESALKDEATRRRLPVSQLVRNILEDTLHIVGDVVDGVDAIVQDSIEMGRSVGRGVARARATISPPPVSTAPPPPTSSAELDDVYAWNEVVPNKPAACSSCGAELLPGNTAFVGLRDEPSRGRAWACSDCIDRLRGA
jgi:hypothetical protein